MPLVTCYHVVNDILPIYLYACIHHCLSLISNEAIHCRRQQVPLSPTALIASEKPVQVYPGCPAVQEHAHACDATPIAIASYPL
jgi:hypothetical protein